MNALPQATALEEDSSSGYSPNIYSPAEHTPLVMNLKVEPKGDINAQQPKIFTAPKNIASNNQWRQQGKAAILNLGEKPGEENYKLTWAKLLPRSTKITRYL